MYCIGMSIERTQPEQQIPYRPAKEVMNELNYNHMGYFERQNALRNRVKLALNELALAEFPGSTVLELATTAGELRGVFVCLMHQRSTWVDIERRVPGKTGMTAGAPWKMGAMFIRSTTVGYPLSVREGYESQPDDYLLANGYVGRPFSKDEIKWLDPSLSFEERGCVGIKYKHSPKRLFDVELTDYTAERFEQQRDLYLGKIAINPLEA